MMIWKAICKTTGKWAKGQLLTVKKTMNTDERKVFLIDENINISDIYNHLYTLLSEVFPETLCRFTGERDTEDNEIFEGDILLIQHYHHTEYAEVKYGQYQLIRDYEKNTQHIGFYVETDDEFEEDEKIQQEFPAILNFCKVVGNVHTERIDFMTEEEMSCRDRTYIKTPEEPLTKLYECLQLLDVLADNDIVQRDPNNRNNIITYRTADELNPEGWYSQNIFTVAEELLYDIEGQQFLRNELESRGIEMQFKNIPEFSIYGYEDTTSNSHSNDYER